MSNKKPINLLREITEHFNIEIVTRSVFNSRDVFYRNTHEKKENEKNKLDDLSTIARRILFKMEFCHATTSV